MLRLASLAGLALVLSACAAQEATPAAGPSSGKVSLQTPPYTGDLPSAPPAPDLSQAPPTAEGAPTFDSVAAQFDPGRQHFVWVLPPGVHGKGPWDMKAIVKLRGEPKFETTLPLKAELAAAGSRPEYPAGYEIVRLTDDGRWAERTAEIDRVIQNLIAEHGRGHGSLEMSNDLNVSIDPAHRQAYCVENRQPDVRMYVEEDGVSELIRLDVSAMAGLIQAAVKMACTG